MKTVEYEIKINKSLRDWKHNTSGHYILVLVPGGHINFIVLGERTGAVAKEKVTNMCNLWLNRYCGTHLPVEEVFEQ